MDLFNFFFLAINFINSVTVSLLMGIFESLLIGIAIASIPGPIFFEVVRRTLTRGFWRGALVAVGEFIGHILLLSLIFLGVSSFLTNIYSTMVLYLVGSSLLLWLGISALRTKKKHIERAHQNVSSKPLIVGFGISVTDPLLIALWISLSGSYLAQYATPLAFLQILLIAAGFLIFFFPLAGIINYNKKRIPSKYIIKISKISGMVLLFFAVSFLYRFIKLIAG